MKIIIATIKFIVTLPAALFGLAFFAAGVFFLYGGPYGDAFAANMLAGAAIAVGIDAIISLLVLTLYRFNKRLILTLLILHEILLFFFLALMGFVTVFSQEIPRIMVHPIILAVLIAGGYGIFKTVKAIQAESRK